jgi:hypothetical protein
MQICGAQQCKYAEHNNSKEGAGNKHKAKSGAKDLVPPDVLSYESRNILWLT